MADNYNRLTPEGESYIKQVTAPDRVWTGDGIKTEYYHDEMPEYGVFPPDLYVEVLNKEEISAIMKYAYENYIPVTVRGSGTGLAGGATCKFGGILISVLRMNKIYEVDQVNMTITAEPGALLTDIAAAAKDAGLFYPPDPGEKTASIGGTVITNAGGMRAVRYGLTRDYVRAIEAVLPDGEIVQFSSNVVKNTTGYDLKDVVIGSEGTLCICTQVTLKLLAAPKHTCTLVVPYQDVEPCIGTVGKLLHLSFIPTAIEFVEAELLEMVERCLGKPFPDNSGAAYLIVMYDGSTAEEVEKACEQAAETCIAEGALDVLFADSIDRIEAVWNVRGAVLEGMKADSEAQEECDVVVPRAGITEFVKAAKEIGRKYNIRIITVGHAGDGNIHTEMLRNNLSDEEWKQNTQACLQELYAKAKELGGQLSGEHGIGNGRLDYLPDFVGARMYKLFKSVKLAFDERNILNPGKVVEFK